MSQGRFLAGRTTVNLHGVILWAEVSSTSFADSLCSLTFLGFQLALQWKNVLFPPNFLCAVRGASIFPSPLNPSLNLLSPGNCGCAFLQIDVGRSSWSLDRPFVTLLPATMLMSLADSKQGKNRSGVRMFKDGKKVKAEMGNGLSQRECKKETQSC